MTEYTTFVTCGDRVKEIRGIRQCSHLSREQCEMLIAEVEAIDWSSRVVPGESRGNEIAYQKVRHIVNRAKEIQ